MSFLDKLIFARYYYKEVVKILPDLASIEVSSDVLNMPSTAKAALIEKVGIAPSQVIRSQATWDEMLAKVKEIPEIPLGKAKEALAYYVRDLSFSSTSQNLQFQETQVQLVSKKRSSRLKSVQEISQNI